MNRTFRLLPVVGAVLVLGASLPAWAVYQCGDQVDSCQCNKNNPFPCCDNGGNCTWWAWEAGCCNWGAPGLPTYGNAKDWINEAKAAGWPVGSTAMNNTVFVRTIGDYGHVGWVYQANADGSWRSSEMGCWSWYGVRTNLYHAAGYAQGFICHKGDPCTPCTSHHHTACDAGDVWWFDSCGHREDKAAGCDDGNGCTVDTCEGGGCVHRPTGHHHTGCDAGDLWWFDSCGNRQDLAADCADGNPCTDDTCEGGACAYPPNQAACDDGDPCTLGDQCREGGCTGEALDCSGLSGPCASGRCQAGACVAELRTGACDDGDPCTVADTCDGASCKGFRLNCAPAGDACNEGLCEDGACIRQPRPGPCDDGDPCTLGDACADGKCRGTAVDCTAFEDDCHVATCQAGLCVTALRPPRVPPIAETCNGRDDDCDGEVDEGFDLGAACVVGVGACARPGVLACDAGTGAAACTGDPGRPSVEVCNLVDDDCDGETDEGEGDPCHPVEVEASPEPADEAAGEDAGPRPAGDIPGIGVDAVGPGEVAAGDEAGVAADAAADAALGPQDGRDAAPEDPGTPAPGADPMPIGLDASGGGDTPAASSGGGCVAARSPAGAMVPAWLLLVLPLLARRVRGARRGQ